jgi:hypothetical protein
MSGVRCPHCADSDTDLVTTDPSGNREAASCLFLLRGSGLLFAVPVAWVIYDNTLGGPLVVGVVSLVAIIIAITWNRGKPPDPREKRVWKCYNCGYTWD